MGEDFDQWNELKKSLSRRNKRPPYREREIWWYAAGRNIGSEIDGKGPRFSRPILVVRKYGEATFFGVPLSTRKVGDFWYSKITVKNKNRCALLSQAGSYSVNRLYGRIGKVSKNEFEEICAKLQVLLFKK